MNIVDEIKERANLADIAGRYTQLDRAGSNGRLRGLCPLHQEKSPSFFVFSDSQRWHCFGCNRGGDVFDLLEAREGHDFRTALQEMARQTGIDLPDMTDTQRERQRLDREREAVLAAAVTHWHSLFPNSPGETYARARAWTADTCTEAGIGYHDGNTTALQRAMHAAGIDLNAPTARAVLQTPAQSLIYPHYRMGRVVYYAARSIEGKRHWNPPADLVGARQLYLNHHYRHDARRVVVVEGQGDAVSLAQLGHAAVAMAGTAVEDGLVDLLKRARSVVVGVEANDAGKKAARKLATRLGALTRLLYWPDDDANRWLVNGLTPGVLDAAIDVAPTLLDTLVDEAAIADPEDAEDALRAVFSVLVGVEQFALTKIQDEICKKLDLTKSVFTSMLRIARMDAGLDQHGKPAYEVIGGQICRRTYDRQGGESIQSLFNGNAWITADIVEDDGEEQSRVFQLEGKLAAGGALHAVEVTAEDFGKMSWILTEWGAHAMVAAGSASKDHLRTAIQTLSDRVETRHEYAHLGWRLIDGARCYLTSSGAVGKDGVQVRLHSDLKRYKLPTFAAPEQIAAGARASLRFLEVGDHTITIPILAAMFLAPLSTLLPPAFTVWLFGSTGSMKSTVAALAMCHYGEFSYNLPAPASWVSTTAYAMRVKAFTAKDAPLWVDDYAAQSTSAGDRELKKLAETLIREWGNRSGRSAGQADGSLRRTHDPRGLVVSTAEQLPPNPSIHPRLYAVEIHPGHITHGAGSNLTRAQTEDAGLYPFSMYGYLQWLAGQWDTLAMELPNMRHQFTEKARAGMSQHLRSPANVAIMFIGWALFIRYVRDLQVIDAATAEGWLVYGWDILVSIGEHQDAEINREEDPIRMYFEGLEQMLLQGTVYLKHVAMDTPDKAWPKPENRTDYATFLGWYDENYYYLIEKGAFNSITAFYRAGGTVFPDSSRGIKVKLLEKGLLHPTESDKYRYRLLVGTEKPWVLRIARPGD